MGLGYVSFAIQPSKDLRELWINHLVVYSKQSTQIFLEARGGHRLLEETTIVYKGNALGQTSCARVYFSNVLK